MTMTMQLMFSIGPLEVRGCMQVLQNGVPANSPESVTRVSLSPTKRGRQETKNREGQEEAQPQAGGSETLSQNGYGLNQVLL